MFLGIAFPLLTLLLVLCTRCHGDPTILLNAPLSMGGPGIGGLYPMGVGGHPSFLFDRDDVDVLYGHPGIGSPILPAASPIVAPPTIVMVDRPQAGNTVINNGMSDPIPGVRYVVPRRRSSRRMSSPYYRRRRFGYYG